MSQYPSDFTITRCYLARVMSPASVLPIQYHKGTAEDFAQEFDRRPGCTSQICTCYRSVPTRDIIEARKCGHPVREPDFNETTNCQSKPSTTTTGAKKSKAETQQQQNTPKIATAADFGIDPTTERDKPKRRDRWPQKR